MATAEKLDIRSYCDTVYNELTAMRSKLQELIDNTEQVEDIPQVENVVKTHAAHLHDIMGMIDWKMQILTKACPADWTKYPEGAEREVHVKEPDASLKEQVALGEVGG
ncbi:MAG: hypothetical protein AB1805_02145 [Nitrospirota bacterium]